MAKHFHKIKVKRVIRETPDAVSIVLDVPGELKDDFQYEAGQYITLRIPAIGDERRSYSLSSSPLEDEWKVTVKEMKDGWVSAWINRELEEGLEVECMPPEGHFTIKWDPEETRAFYFFAAGSGITPVISMIKTGLEREPRSAFFLLYGSRTEEDIIFEDELKTLEKRYAGQLEVVHTLSGQKGRFFSRLLGGRPEGKRWTGRIDPQRVEHFLQEYPAGQRTAHHLICGPGEMIESVENKLKSMGVEKKNILKEYFTPAGKAKADPEKFEESLLVAHLDGQTYETRVPEGETILDALIELGADPPYSCTAGVCSTCAARVIEGKVEMDTCLALDEDELAEGMVLTCQSHPVTPRIEVDYDNVS